ncbi:MAG: glycine cleavage system protein H [Bacteroidales bacterium]|nr:glycine cleavage system protein H [Bacteroidales bacterium]
MDGFSYHDIFDTKGIEYLVIIAFLILIVPFWRALNKPLKSELRLKEAAQTLSGSLLKIPQGLFYGRNHTWAHLERSGIARIGLDDLLLHITGPVKVKHLKEAGERIQKGEVLAEIYQGEKLLRIESPLSGIIEKVNSDLNDNPGNLTLDPYGKGWLAAIQPENWVPETSSLFFSRDASRWEMEELASLKDFIALEQKKYSPGESLVILQEGGELNIFPLSEMTIEVWRDFQEKFLDRK